MADAAERALRNCLARDPASFDNNWLVEAGAGAGKTYLIVQRMVNQLVLGACEPEQLVAITFTNKATNQLRDRLTDALLEHRRNAREERLCRRLDEVLERMDAIQISTVHSFCQRLLREMPLEAGLPFSFTLQDEREAARDHTRFFYDCCREHPDWFDEVRAYGVQPTSLKGAFLELLDCGDDEIVRHDDDALAEVARESVALAEQMRQTWLRAFPARWQPDWCTPFLRQLLSFPAITDPRQALAWASLTQGFAKMTQTRGKEHKLPIIRHRDDGQGHIKYDAKKQFDVQLVIPEDAPVTEPWRAYYTACLHTLEATTALQKAQNAKKPDPARLLQAQADLRRCVAAMQAHRAAPECQFVSACDALLRMRKEAADPLPRLAGELLHAVILKALVRCRDALTARKTARGLVSYDDLLLRCRDMLKNSAAARAGLSAPGFPGWRMGAVPAPRNRTEATSPWTPLRSAAAAHTARPAGNMARPVKDARSVTPTGPAC